MQILIFISLLVIIILLPYYTGYWLFSSDEEDSAIEYWLVGALVLLIMALFIFVLCFALSLLWDLASFIIK